MQLSANFSLEEMTKSQAALRLRINNTPPPAAVEALRALCVNVLQPARDQFGPLIVSSGYRCPRLNAVIGGARLSQHMSGEAADIEALKASNLDLARWLEKHLKFDQLILEYHTPGEPSSGWVHVSWRANANRNQVLTVTPRGATHRGLAA
jgi:hypothetical protein